MTPRTRNSNKDANFKVYYSKKVPQQVYFPQRRKTVRRPDEVGKDGVDKRQMRFLPEKMKMKRVNTVQDSDEEADNEDVEEGGVALDVEAEHEEIEERGSRGESANNRVKKRRSDVFDANEDDEDEPSRPTSKRRRQSATNSKRRSRPVKAESEDEADPTPAPARGNVDRKCTLRRQSTMTQLVEGRRPLSETEEPGFKPVKRSPRLSWRGQNKQAKDKKQRTLTQMVPGIGPTEPLSDSETEVDAADAEAEERESQAYGEAIVARLAQEGLVGVKSDDVEVPSNEGETLHDEVTRSSSTTGHEVLDQHLDVPLVVVNSIEDDLGDDDEASYQPTQFIDAPVTRTNRGSRQASGKKQGALRVVEAPATVPRSMRKSRFSLLSTPEKRRIREIPSSQSPADSPLSTQVSPSKKHRLPLKERSGNNTQVAETPSRRKQVTFREPTKDPLPPPTLRKFNSTIQDSEDEDEEILESDENASTVRIGAPTQALVHGIDNAASGKDLGTETQAMLDQIDQACADSENGDARESSQKLNGSAYARVQNEPSPELGERFQTRNSDREEDSQDTHPLYRTAHAGIKEGEWDDVEMLDLTTQQADVPLLVDSEFANASIELPADTEQMPSSPPIIQQPIEETGPSTPMVIMDSSDDDDEIDPTPPRKTTPRAPQPSSTALQQSADLDEQLVQVPRSPTAQHDTQQSHSSRAEQQLHNEWFSYSQYVNAHPPQSSSMNVAHDKFSYHATPKPPRPLVPPQQSGHYTSQATTVDEVTPRKNRTQRTYSANTTPHKIASSQPIISPSKPPPLFIPSSFPSPAKARMEEWSSPVLGNTQMTYGVGGSLEDFSIPLPPPVEDDWMDG
jgi:hypothetical protein